MNLLEVSGTFNSVKIFVNDSLVRESVDVNSIAVEVLLPSNVAIEFTPYKQKPIVRFNNFMLNYWLANILLQDHRLEFYLGENFYSDYKNKDISGRIAHLSNEQKNIDHFYDKYIGINNMHPSLVNEIKELIK